MKLIDKSVVLTKDDATHDNEEKSVDIFLERV